MKLSHTFAAITLAAAALAAAPVVQAQITATELAFARGATSTAVNGAINGAQTRDYVIRARAGQTMRVTLTGSPIVFFNVLAPGSTGEAIFTGSSEGNSFSGTLGVSGAYKIRVYQMRVTARRGQVGKFGLRVSVTGGGPGNGAGNGAGMGSGLGGLAGMRSVAAIDAMRERGFRNVDDTTLGNTQYAIYFNGRTRVCAQLTMANGKVTDARDIKTHPNCR